MTAVNALLLLMVAASCISAQHSIPGQCPSRQVVKPFKMTRMLGKWYQQAQHMTPTYRGYSCYTDVFTKAPNGTFRIVSSQFRTKTNTWQGAADYKLAFSNSRKEGKLLVTHDYMEYKDYRLWIIDTDYTSYLVAWRCWNFNKDNYMQFLYLETRKKIVNPQLIANLTAKLTAQGFNTALLSPVPQNCTIPMPTS